MSKTDHGRFAWYDLMSQDPAGSQAFYTELLGWRVERMDLGPQPYDMLFMGDRAQGGIAKLDDADIPSHWVPYIAVDDVAVSCEQATGLGGLVRVPATDIGPGTLAVITDPQGATFSLWKGKEPLPEPPAKGAAGMFCWNECMTNDATAAQGFYEGLFGWRTETADMEVGGCSMTYRLLFQSDQHHGGILDLPAPALEQGARPHWLSYVTVTDVDATLEKATGLGAKVMCLPTDIPQAGRFCVIQDPQGAMLALFKDA